MRRDWRCCGTGWQFFSTVSASLPRHHIRTFRQSQTALRCPHMPLEPVAFGGLSFSRKRDPEISSKLFAFCVQFRYLFVGEHAVRPPFVLPCLGPVGLDRGAGFLLCSGSLGLARSAGAASKAGIARTRGITRLPAGLPGARTGSRGGGCRSDLESVFLCNAGIAVREPVGRSREQESGAGSSLKGQGLVTIS